MNTGISAWKELCKKKASISLEAFIKRYGETEGLKHKQKYLDRWHKGIEKRKKQGKWDNGSSLESFIKKHGEEEGYKRWDHKRQILKKRFTKKWFIEKYGEEEGTKLSKEYNEKMANLSLIGRAKQSEIINKQRLTNGIFYSKISQDLFWKIKKFFLNDDDKCYFAENNGEKIFLLEENEKNGPIKKWFAVDFLYKDKIIEFDGEYWHKHKSNANLKDTFKDECLVKRGFKVLRVMESEYEKEPLLTLKKCLIFLELTDEQ